MKRKLLALIEESYDQLYQSIESAADSLEREFRSAGRDAEFLESKLASTFILTWMRGVYHLSEEAQFSFWTKRDAIFGT